MAQTKKTFSTAKGTAVYPWLTRADTQYNAEGEYKTKLRVPANDAQPLVDSIRALVKSEFGDNPKGQLTFPFSIDDETGEVTFSMKSKYKPTMVDTTGQVIAHDQIPEVYGGSMIKAQGVLYPYTAGGRVGVSMQMGGVQIIELQANPTNLQFAEEEGSFVAKQADNDNSQESGEAYNF